MHDDLPHYDLAPVERAILTIGPGMDREKMTLLLQLAQAAQQRAAAIVKLCKERMVEVIQAEGQFTIGEIRYYAGTTTETWTENNAGVLEAALIHTAKVNPDTGELAWDFVAAAALLSSKAWKPATCRQAMPGDVFDKLFKSESVPELREGKPVKKLLTADPKFVKGGAR